MPAIRLRYGQQYSRDGAWGHENACINHSSDHRFGGAVCCSTRDKLHSLSFWRLQQKANFSFQLTDRLSGTFRYSGISERTGPGTDGTFDRSFDLHFRFLDETDTRPALAIGLTDFMGTGILSSEYIVATKAVTNQLDVTAGIGWGRLGTRDGRQTSMRAKPNSGASTKPPPLTLVSPIAIAPV